MFDSKAYLKMCKIEEKIKEELNKTTDYDQRKILKDKLVLVNTCRNTLYH